MDNNYARNQGLEILEKIIQEIGPIFSSEEAYDVGRQLSLKPIQVAKTLSKMTKSEWLTRLKRGLYAVRSPLFEADLHPFAVAQALVNPVAISYWSAMMHHGLTTQIPPMVQASTPTKVVTPEMRFGEAYRPRGKTVWKVLDIEIEYIYVKQDKFWGFTQEWVSDWHRVKITDLERTVFDLVARSDLFGGISFAIEIINTNLVDIKVSRLVDYALRYDVGAYIKRLGWILETNGIPEDVLEPLFRYETQNYHLLDPQGMKNGEPITRWNLYNNLRREIHG